MSKFNFKKYGGINNLAQSNIVRNNISYINNNSFDTSGLFNSKENFLSHVDMSGNSLIHVGNIYFQDGTFINTSKYLNPTLADILINGNEANKSINMSGNNINHVNSIYYSNNNTSQSTSYTGYFPLEDTFYDYSTITIDTNGIILDISNNYNSIIPPLEKVLIQGNDGSGLNMKIYDLSLNNNLYVKNINLDGQIIQNQNDNLNILKSTNFYGDISQNDVYIISQTSTKSNNMINTIFNGICNYSNDFSSSFNDLDIPNKKYIDDISSGINPTLECSCSTTSIIDINYPGSTIDTYNLSINDRILVKNQSNKIENGIYQFNSSSSPLTRTNDCTGIIPGNQVSFILNGSVNKSKSFKQNTQNAVVGVDELSYSQYYPLNFKIGTGLELELFNNSTIQLKSNQEFLTNLKITYDDNPGLILKSINDSTKQILLSVNCTSNTSKSNLISSGSNTIISMNSSLFLGTLNSSQYSGIKIKTDEIQMNVNNKSYHSISSTENKISASNFKLINSNNNSIAQDYSGTEQIFYGNTYMNNKIYLTPRQSTFVLSSNSVGYTIFNTENIDWYNSFGSSGATNDKLNKLFTKTNIIPEINKLYLFIFNVDFRYINGPDKDSYLSNANINLYNSSGIQLDYVNFGGIYMSRVQYKSVITGNNEYSYVTMTYTSYFKGSDIKSSTNNDNIITFKCSSYKSGNSNDIYQIRVVSNSCSLTSIS